MVFIGSNASAVGGDGRQRMRKVSMREVLAPVVAQDCRRKIGRLRDRDGLPIAECSTSSGSPPSLLECGPVNHPDDDLAVVGQGDQGHPLRIAADETFRAVDRV